MPDPGTAKTTVNAGPPFSSPVWPSPAALRCASGATRDRNGPPVLLSGQALLRAFARGLDFPAGSRGYATAARVYGIRIESHGCAAGCYGMRAFQVRSACLFNSAECEALHEIALQGREDDGDGDGGEQGRRHHLVPLDAVAACD